MFEIVLFLLALWLCVILWPVLWRLGAGLLVAVIALIGCLLFLGSI